MRSRRRARLVGEMLEPRLMMAADTADISVGRVLSAWSTADIQNNELKITYSVYNQQASDVSGTLLTTTLQPGVTFKNATQLPDQNGQSLAWSLGTIPAFGRASIDVTVVLANTPPLQIDGGAQAFGIMEAAAVTDAAPAARLRTDTIDASLLASTADANTTDPFILAKAAELDYDPNQFFQFLTQDIGYESYVGSLRGARGTMWSSAGNSLDEASLGIALFRSSGIPARYAHGILSNAWAQQLILSMFPASFQTVGVIPANTPIADPAHDPKLLQETRPHYWVEFDTGSGFQAADGAFASALLGQTFATADDRFAEVADSLRHKVTVRLNRELTIPAVAQFAGGSGQNVATVLNETFTAAELVGKPLSIGHFVDQVAASTPVASSTTNNYSPFILMGDTAYDSSRNQMFRGTDYQELITSFPLGSQVLTGLFLEIDLSGPDGPTETFERTLFDRFGFDVRQNGGTTSQTFDPSGDPPIGPLDVWTIGISPSLQDPTVPGSAEADRLNLYLKLVELSNTENPVGELQVMRDKMVAETRSYLAALLDTSDRLTAGLAQQSRIRAYFDRPRITLVSTTIAAIDDQTVSQSFEVDLRRDSIRAELAPGQNLASLRGFQGARGIIESGIETDVFPLFAPQGSGIQVQQPVSTRTVLQAASRQGIPSVTLSIDNSAELDALDISAEAKARISVAIQAGKSVFVPRSAPLLNGQRKIAWYQINNDTGEVIGIGENGGHESVVEGVFIFSATFYGTVRIFDATLLPFISFVAARAHFSDLESLLTPCILDRLKGSTSSSAVYFIEFSVAKEVCLGIISTLTEQAIASYDILALSPISQLVYETNMREQMEAFRRIHKDPAVPTQWIGTEDLVLSFTNVGNNKATIAANQSAGAAAGTLATPSTHLQGQLTASWNSSTNNALTFSSLSASSATVRDSVGNIVGSGTVALADFGPQSASISGTVAYSVAGQATVVSYGPALAALGTSAEWESYAADLTGTVNITLQSAGLQLNGEALPAGTYTISAAAAHLTGSDAKFAPNFSSGVTIQSTIATLQLAPGSGNITIGGNSIDLSRELTLGGFTGTVTIVAGGATDSVALSGAVAQVLQVSGSPAAVITDQNHTATFSFGVQTSVADTYTLIAKGPADWTVSIDDNRQVSVTPAPGTPAGVYTVHLIGVAQSNTSLLAQGDVTVAVTAVQPAVSLEIQPDAQYFVTYNGAQVPTAYRATLRNLGPTADTFQLTFPNVPAGFEVQSTMTAVTIPAGETAVVGLYLNPVGQLPAPGAPAAFTVTGTSTSNVVITATDTESFTIPAIHGVTLVADPPTATSTPGTPVNIRFRIQAVGNVAENITFDVDLSTGMQISGPSSVSLNPGQVSEQFVTLTPAANHPLNATSTATITANFDGREEVKIQIPIRVAVPGADAIAAASVAANQLGKTDLANRLNDLSIALTNLVQTPASELFKTQALAALDALIGQLKLDPYTAPQVPALQLDRTALSNAVTTDQTQFAVSVLGIHLRNVATTLADAAKYNFTLSFVESSQTGVPLQPTTYQVVLQNTGTQAATYDLSVIPLAGGANASISPSSITLQPGQVSPGTPGVPNIFVTVTSNFSFQITPLTFQVNATARNAAFGEINKTIVGQFIPRPEVIQVVSVAATPPFTNAGGLVNITANLLNAVNQQQSADVTYTISNSQGNIVFTSPQPVPVTLNVLTTLTPVNLGAFNTTGLPNDTYTISVSVNGATGTGTLLVGTPISASLTSTPSTALSGNQTITNTLQIDSQTALPTPFTLVGQLAASGSGGVAVLDNLAYVGTPTGIHVVNVTNPALPLDQATFGAADLGANTNIQLQVYQDKLVVLAATFEGTNNKLLVYSLTNPAVPTLLGQAPVNLEGSAAQDVTLALDAIADNLVFTSSRAYRFNLFTGEIFQQFGESIVIDISNPAAPTIKSIVYNQPPDPVNQPGFPDGSSNIWQAVSVNSTTELIATTTATHDVYSGSTVKGVVMVVDKSNPAAPVVLQKLEIPNMAVVTGISVQGNQAFIIGSSQYWSGHRIGLAGRIVVGLLDLTNPQAPTVISTQITAVASGDISNITSLGNSLFVTYGLPGFDNNNADVLLFDASDPANIVVIQQDVPQSVNYLASKTGLLFTTDGSNLLIYSLAAEPAAIPVVASVQVPKDAGATILPNSFNVPPTQIITGATFDTLIWNTSLSNAAPSRTFTWQSNAFLNPGEARTVALGGTVEFASQNTPGEIELPPQFTTGQQIIGITPLTQTKAPGSTFTYNVTLINPSPDNFTYETTLQGLPASWVNLPFQTPVPANGSVTIPLTITTDAFANIGDYPFSVTVRTNSGATGLVQGDLVLQGEPTRPDPDAHGVVASLTPASATTGQGMSANYVVRVTNAGSVTESFHLSASGLPVGFVATFAQNDIEIPPGASNFIDVPVQIVTPISVAAASYPFTVTAASTTTAVSDSTSGAVNVTGLGVRVDITPSSAVPGNALQFVITNTGGQTDTFDLALGGPAGLVSSLSTPSVTLAAGTSQTVTIQVGEIDFAVPGGLLLSANATSRANADIKSTDTATITIDGFLGLTTEFTPAAKEIPTPATVSFLLNVHNSGNIEDGYVAIIVSTAGPLTASLVGLDGVPAQTIPVFRLPGLTSGEILLIANLADFGTGTITVQIRSLTNDALIAEAVATVTTGEIAIEYDFGDAPASFGTTLSADGARHLPVGPYLGSNRDGETEALADASALGDDNNGLPDDEDGIVLPGLLVAGTCDCSGTALGNTVTVNASATGFLDAWIDFNRNGLFDANEQVATSFRVFAGANTLTVNVPTSASTGASFARFRISSAGGLGPTGEAADGEVEDYAVQLFNPTGGSSEVVADPNNANARVLYIKGTAFSDAIVVRQTSSTMVTVYVSPFGTTSSFPLNSFDRIVICAGAGSDAIAIEAPITKPSVIYGDEDNDSISGGLGPDIIFGGSGVDTIAGNAGNDTISSGPGIDTLSGGDGVDRLVESGSGTMSLSNTQFKNGSEINTLAYFEAATLSGGNSADSFDATGWSWPLSIDGGGGMNSLVDGGNANFTLTETTLARTIGTVTRTISIANIQSAVLTGGTSNNTFNLAAWPFGATLNGGAGTDTFLAAGDGDFTLTDAMLLRTNLGMLRLNALENATVTGGGSANTFNVGAWTKAATLNAGGGIDKLIVSGNVATTLSNTSLTRTGRGTLSLTSFEAAEINDGAGSNAITATSFSGELKVDGGAGNDTILGGSGPALLLGGLGNDTLRSGTGRTVMIGGLGLDKLTGGTNDDLMISGQTVHDTNALALAMILAEWASTASYADRVAHLTGTLAGGLNGTNRLDGTNVIHDNAIDILLGGLGTDLFFAKQSSQANSPKDSYVDKTSTEKIF